MSEGKAPPTVLCGGGGHRINVSSCPDLPESCLIDGRFTVAAQKFALSDVTETAHETTVSITFLMVKWYYFPRKYIIVEGK